MIRSCCCNAWQTDKVIDAVNKVVALTVGSDMNQTTLLSQTRSGFKAVTTESIHILHDQNHWITTALIGNEVKYADSLSRPISPSIQKQRLQLYKYQTNVDGTLPFAMVPGSQQNNATDCGLYAAAFAFEWAQGHTDRLMTSFAELQMR